MSVSKPHQELKSFRDLDTETLAKMVYCAVDTPGSVLAERVKPLLDALRPFADVELTDRQIERGEIDWRLPVEWVLSAKKVLGA